VHRVCEALCLKLVERLSTPSKSGSSVPWGKIIDTYGNISRALMSNAVVIERTTCLLPDLSTATLSKW